MSSARSTLAVDRPDPVNPRDYRMLINGEWVPSASGEVLESRNPTSGQTWATVPQAGDEDVDRAVRSARRALDEGPWGRMSGTERGRLLRQFASVLADHADVLAELETTDNGKLLREMQSQLTWLPEWYTYFAGAADKIRGRTINSTKTDYLVYTRPEPVGVCAGITPWNSPIMLLTWKLAPALAAGCTFVAKPAEQTSVATLEFAKLFELAGFPPGVVNVITGQGPTAGQPLVRHPDVNRVAFTGSTRTGIQVMKDAAEHLARGKP